MNEAFKELESTDHVPPYLKHALVSEINVVRDILQFVTHFTGGLFTTALTSLTEINELES